MFNWINKNTAASCSPFPKHSYGFIRMPKQAFAISSAFISITACIFIKNKAI